MCRINCDIFVLQKYWSMCLTPPGIFIMSIWACANWNRRWLLGALKYSALAVLLQIEDRWLNLFVQDRWRLHINVWTVMFVNVLTLAHNSTLDMQLTALYQIYAGRLKISVIPTFGCSYEARQRLHLFPLAFVFVSSACWHTCSYFRQHTTRIELLWYHFTHHRRPEGEKSNIHVKGFKKRKNSGPTKAQCGHW